MKFDLDISKYKPEFIQYVINTVKDVEPEKIHGSIIKETLNGFLKGRDGLTQEQYSSMLSLLAASYKTDEPRMIKNCLAIGNKYVRVRSMFKALTGVDDADSRIVLFTAFLDNVFKKHLTKVSETFEEEFTQEVVKKMVANKNYRWQISNPVNMTVSNGMIERLDDAEFCSIIAGLFNMAAVTDLQDIHFTVKDIATLEKFGGETIDKRLIRLADEYDIFSVMAKPRATQCINTIVKEMKADYRKKDPNWRTYQHSEDITDAILYFLMGGDGDRLETLKFEMKIGR